jgi:hypothetical protein
MRLSILSTTLAFALATANPHFGQWKPAGQNDCMMEDAQLLVIQIANMTQSEALVP